MRFNQLQPPFNNEKLRQALLYLVDQQDIMTALAGDEKNWKRSAFSYYACGTPMASEAGAEPLKGKRNIEKAKALIKEAGYNGERIVLITATDQPIVNAQAQSSPRSLRQLGLNVDLQAMDWGTLINQHRKNSADKNGWSIFFTWLVGPDMVNPAINMALLSNGEKTWFGWPSDEKIEAMRAQWLDAPDLAAQKKLRYRDSGASIRQRSVHPHWPVCHPHGLSQ